MLGKASDEAKIAKLERQRAQKELSAKIGQREQELDLKIHFSQISHI